MTRELALFAAVGFLIGGVDDLIIDLIWIGRSAWRSLIVYRRHDRVSAATIAPPDVPGRLAIFVAAWREEAVIGGMVSTALRRLRHPEWRLYVGCYPNDPETIEAVERAANGDRRVRIVIGDVPGGTTKAGCLNWIWQAMLEDERAEGMPFKAIVLHDAEDVVHPDELTVYDALIGRFDLVQLPVHALTVRGEGAFAALVSSHYCGEFSEAHSKQVVVREAIGAAVPSAGVGCAIERSILAPIAEGRDGPFDPDSLTEDYELGLRIGRLGGRGAFVRLPASDGSGMVEVRACFPHSMVSSVKQKSRWTTGIALAGWDRLGWSGGVAEHWMRLRDRRAPLAALVLACGYVALAGWGVTSLAVWMGYSSPGPMIPMPLLLANLGLLGWRIGMRATVTARSHGWRMATLTPIHLLIGNLVAMAASVRAIGLYWKIIRNGQLRWDKTAHVLPRGEIGEEV